MRKPRENGGAENGGVSTGKLILALALPSAFFIAVAGYQFGQAQLGADELRSFAEAKAAEILGAKVKIGGIHYAPPTGIALQGIQIEEPQPAPAFSVSRVENLVFGYGLLNFVRGDFKIPTHILFLSPSIRFHSRRPLLPFLEGVLTSPKTLPAELVIRQGEFRYPWGEGRNELILSEVQVKAKIDARGRIQLELSSQLKGVAQGSMKIRGLTDPQFRHYDLEVQLEGVSFLAESGIPLKAIRGNFRVSEKVIQTVGLTSLFHDWEVQWKTRVEEWQTVPKISLDVTHEKGAGPFQFSMRADFHSNELEGHGSWRGRVYPFQGKVLQQGEGIVFSDLVLPHGYGGSGKVDPSNGDYEFECHRDRRRIQLHSNLSRPDFETEFQLDHVSVNRLDWVVLGRARIIPLPKPGGGAASRFKAQIETDYFIAEFEPLQDFRGSFELSAEGMRAIDFQWGGVFHLEGQILMKGKEPRQDLVLRVDGFPLETIEDFAGRPIPSNLRGALEGKLKFRGEPKRPEVQGYFTIKEGAIEKLDFDRAIVQFQGFPPYLRLYDSKIFRGRNTLKLTGAIDLARENFFQGIQIKGPDSLVIWKGLSVGWKEDQSAIEAEKPLSSRVVMGLAVGSGVSDSQEGTQGESRVVAGPKVKF